MSDTVSRIRTLDLLPDRCSRLHIHRGNQLNQSSLPNSPLPYIHYLILGIGIMAVIDRELGFRAFMIIGSVRILPGVRIFILEQLDENIEA